MSITDKLNADMKDAMRAKDSARLSVLRMILSDIKNTAIDKKQRDTGLSDDDVVLVLRKAEKKRQEAATQFEAGGRMELAEKEQCEASIIKEYLPALMGDDQIRAAVDQVIAETGATSPKETGVVMKAVMGKLQGQADGSVVSKLVKERLSGS